MSDPGILIVEQVRSALDPEPEYSTELPRGFAWWPWRAPQQVHAEEVRSQSGTRLVRVHVDLALALRVEGTGAVFGRLAQWNAARHGLSSARWDAETGLVSLHACVTAGASDAAWAAQRLAHAALLQITESLAASVLTQELGGEPPADCVPGGGVREAPSALSEIGHTYAERGSLGAALSESALATVRSAQPAPWSRIEPAPGGFHAELPAAAPGDPRPGSAPGAGSALLRVQTAQAHPRFGSGLLVLLSAPVDAEPVSARFAATAALLNEAEAREWTGLDQLGGWCVHPDAGLVHATFLPALVMQEGLIERLMWQSAARARWMRGFLARVSQLRTTPGA